MTKKKSVSKKSTKSSTVKKPQSLKALKESVKVEQDKYVRLFAEFENYKRRTSKERLELYKTAGKEVLTSMVPILEDFKRALSQENTDSDNEGFKLIYQ